MGFEPGRGAPESVVFVQLNAWDKIIVEKSAANPTFATVSESMKTFAQRAGRWQNDTLVDYKMAYRHFFDQKGPKKV